MAEVGAFFRGQDGAQLTFYLFRFFTLRQPQPAAYADAVGITDYAARFFIKISQEQIGCLSADTGQLQKLFHSAGDFTVVLA